MYYIPHKTHSNAFVLILCQAIHTSLDDISLDDIWLLEETH